MLDPYCFSLGRRGVEEGFWLVSTQGIELELELELKLELELGLELGLEFGLEIELEVGHKLRLYL